MRVTGCRSRDFCRAKRLRLLLIWRSTIAPNRARRSLGNCGATCQTSSVSPRNGAIASRSVSENASNASLQLLGSQLDPCDVLREKIKKTLNEEAPVAIGKGNAIASGVSKELDELRAIANGGKEYLDQMLARESQKTGITSLKIASNNVFGYYIEVRNTHKDKVPSDWIRKQTLVSAERYITEELKEYEAKITPAV